MTTTTAGITKNETVTVNEEGRLFVLRYEGQRGGGYSCLGFDVCEEKITRYATALGVSRPETVVGSLESYAALEKLIAVALARNTATGARLEADLTPQLVGLEGKRVEVVDKYGEKRRFIVGKSTGWIPIHLEIHNRRSTGGGSVTGAPFQSIRVVTSSR